MTHEQPQRGQTEEREDDKYDLKQPEQGPIAVAWTIGGVKDEGPRLRDDEVHVTLEDFLCLSLQLAP